MTAKPTVPSLTRALRVLEFLAQSKRGFSISDLSRQLKVPKSSLHLIMTTLEQEGYLQKNTRNGQFRLGLKLVGLSRAALDGLSLRDTARPYLEALMKKTKLTVHMGVLERNEAVIIEKIEAPGIIKVATWIGRRMDVNCTGIGKALIATIPEEQLAAQVRAGSLARHNYKTIVSLPRLKQEMASVREKGYSFDDEEDEIGLRCIGVALTSEGKAMAAISVAGTTAQIPHERVESIAGQVRKTAAQISAQLKYN